MSISSRPHIYTHIIQRWDKLSSGSIPLCQWVLKRKRYCRIAGECQIELPHPCLRVQKVSQMKLSMAKAVVTAEVGYSVFLFDTRFGGRAKSQDTIRIKDLEETLDYLAKGRSWVIG